MREFLFFIVAITDIAKLIVATHAQGDDIAQHNQNHEVQEDLNVTTTLIPPAFVAQQIYNEVNHNILASLLDTLLLLGTNQEVANLLHLEDFDSTSADDDQDVQDYDNNDDDYDVNQGDDYDEYDYDEYEADSDEENEGSDEQIEIEYTATTAPPSSGVVNGWVV